MDQYDKKIAVPIFYILNDHSLRACNLAAAGPYRWFMGNGLALFVH
jgi:hypothetical protein